MQNSQIGKKLRILLAGKCQVNGSIISKQIYLSPYPGGIFVKKKLSAYSICCIYSNVFQNTFIRKQTLRTLIRVLIKQSDPTGTV